MTLLASNLLSWTRYDEVAYRYGGEEFIIIIRTKTDEQACQAGLRLCRLIGQKKIPYSDGEIAITVTAGITRVQPGETLDTALDALDALNATGKTIGVISHVEAMKERIPVQIKVKKINGLGYSRLDKVFAVE